MRNMISPRKTRPLKTAPRMAPIEREVAGDGSRLAEDLVEMLFGGMVGWAEVDGGGEEELNKALSFWSDQPSRGDVKFAPPLELYMYLLAEIRDAIPVFSYLLSSYNLIYLLRNVICQLNSRSRILQLVFRSPL